MTTTLPNKKAYQKGCTLKDGFKNTAYLERGVPYFVFADTDAVLVSKIDEDKEKALPLGELPMESGERGHF